MIKKLLFISTIVLVASAAFAYSQYQKFLETPLDFSPESKIFNLERGWSGRQLSQKLVEEAVLEDATFFAFYLRISQQANKLQAGEYLLTSGITARELVYKFTQGDVTSYKITIIEGWSFKKLRLVLAENKYVTHALADVDDSQLMKKLGLKTIHPEGQFLPDTYYFSKGTSDLDILRDAHRALNEALQEAWKNRAKDVQLKSSYEVLIMASIIEKETGAAEERKKISGVFNLRLKKNMKLQTDPTVIYGMGDNYNGNIRRRDLRTDTPYNTYTRKGLPPTPIALPGRASIEAAVSPDKGDDLYFVAKGDGTHQFSESVKEHNAAVRKYQLKK